MEIDAIIAGIGALVGFGIAIPILLQYVNNVSRNMSLGNTAATEEISKVAKKD